MKAARTSSGIVFTLQEVLVLNNRVRRLSSSFGALVFFVILLVLFAAACFFGPWSLLRKLPPRSVLALDSKLETQLNEVYADSRELSEQSADIMRARLSLSESRLEWRMREAPNDPEAANLQQRPEDLQRLLGTRQEKLEAARQANQQLQAQLKELSGKISVEEARLTKELGASGGSLDGQLRTFVEKRETMEEDKVQAQHEIEQLTDGLQEITDQVVRAGVPPEELANGSAYLQLLDKQIQSLKQRPQ